MNLDLKVKEFMTKLDDLVYADEETTLKAVSYTHLMSFFCCCETFPDLTAAIFIQQL